MTKTTCSVCGFSFLSNSVFAMGNDVKHCGVYMKKEHVSDDILDEKQKETIDKKEEK